MGYSKALNIVLILGSSQSVCVVRVCVVRVCVVRVCVVHLFLSDPV